MSGITLTIPDEAIAALAESPGEALRMFDMTEDEFRQETRLA